MAGMMKQSDEYKEHMQPTTATITKDKIKPSDLVRTLMKSTKEAIFKMNVKKSTLESFVSYKNDILEVSEAADASVEMQSSISRFFKLVLPKTKTQVVKYL